MPATAPAQIYKQVAITSASPGQLVLMLLDGAIRFTKQAIDGLDDPDFFRSQELCHNNILRAHAIVSELQGTLDFEKGGQLSDVLFRIYDYLLTQLNMANATKTKQPLLNVIRFVGEIRDAWASMLAAQGANEPT